jgi:hypothetical protein
MGNLINKIRKVAVYLAAGAQLFSFGAGCDRDKSRERSLIEAQKSAKKYVSEMYNVPFDSLGIDTSFILLEHL